MCLFCTLSEQQPGPGPKCSEEEDASARSRTRTQAVRAEVCSRVGLRPATGYRRGCLRLPPCPALPCAREMDWHCGRPGTAPRADFFVLLL